MSDVGTDVLRERIAEMEKELKQLKAQYALKCSNKTIKERTSESSNFSKCNLENKDIERYSRQMILPEIGVSGNIGLVDYDTVDLSNLHRQVLHTEDKIGIDKVQSAVQDLKRINSNVIFHQHTTSLSSQNALDVIQKYDLILDCTDNVATRYLLNDACVLCKKPLISGSALRFEGQLIVYNYSGGPCYRCLYPVPPPPETVTNCSDGGVIGAVTGVIGSLQALEAIKIITNQKSSYNGKMLLYDGMEGTFKAIKLRNRKDTCYVCGTNPSITTLQDYEQFCGSAASDKEKHLNILLQNQRISVEEYEQTIMNKVDHVLIDVRPTVEYEICSLNSSINIPLSDINHRRNLADVENALRERKPVYVVCKRGNDSQEAVKHLIQLYKEDGNDSNTSDDVIFKDLIGGLHAWSKKIDGNFPTY